MLEFGVVGCLSDVHGGASMMTASVLARCAGSCRDERKINSAG